MVVIAIAGIIATLAVPSFQNMVHNYRGLEASRAALAAVSEARGLAQRNNIPVRIRFEAKKVTLSVATFAEAPDNVRKNVTSYTDVRQIALPTDVRLTRLELLGPTGAIVSTFAAGSVDATLVFCSSNDSYFRAVPGGEPVCGIGNLASATARIVMKAVDGDHHIRINAPLGSLDVRSGAL